MKIIIFLLDKFSVSIFYALVISELHVYNKLNSIHIIYAPFVKSACGLQVGPWLNQCLTSLKPELIDHCEGKT